MIYKQQTALLLCSMSLLGACNQRPNNEAKPNVLFILTDDQGWGDFGFNENPHLKTPVLDRLEKEGAHLSSFYVSPLSATTRAGLLTGRDHLRTGVIGVTRSKENMDSEEMTIAEYLLSEGYRTSCFGKWHNGAYYPMNANGQGFQEFIGFNGGHLTNYFDATLEHNGEPHQSKGYITDYLTDCAIEYMKEESDSAFFCFLAYNAPHAPIQVPEEYYKPYESLKKDAYDITPGVYAMCANIDYNVGRIMHFLQQSEIDENTIVIFTTDNGPKNARYNGHLRGVKGHIYEGGIKTPCLIYWKGKIQPIDLQQTLSYIDIMPTILSLCNVNQDIESEREIAGIDFSSLLFGETTDIVNEKLQSRYLFTHKAQPTDSISPLGLTMFNQRYKLVYGNNGQVELYDKEQDPSEQYDLSASKASVVSAMKQHANKWYEKTKDEFSIHQQPFPLIGLVDNELILPAHEALFTPSNIHYYANKYGWAGDWLVGINTDDTISWQLNNKDDKARYEIATQYAYPMEDLVFASVNNGGNIKLLPYVAVDLPSPDFAIRCIAYEQTWAFQPIDTLQLPLGEQKIDLHFRGKKLDSLQVKGIRIRKI